MNMKIFFKKNTAHFNQIRLRLKLSGSASLFYHSLSIRQVVGRLASFKLHLGEGFFFHALIIGINMMKVLMLTLFYF